MSCVAVDLIIVNYRSDRLLEECLASIMEDAAGLPESELKLTVWVEDNSPLPPRSVSKAISRGKGRACSDASDDDALSVIRNFPDVRYSRNPDNPGFGAAVNRAAACGTGDLIILLNPDARVTPGFFSAVLRVMTHCPEIGVLGPRVRETDGRIQHSARSFPTFLTGLFGRDSALSRRFSRHPIVRRNLRSLDVSEVPGASDLVAVDWVSGACMVIRRTALPGPEVFSPGYFMYWEDADLCLRMMRAGYRIRYFTGAAVVHHAGISSRTRPVWSRIQFHWSAFRLYARMLPAPAGLWLAPAAAILALRCLAVIIYERMR